jgi:hypothetical protein
MLDLGKGSYAMGALQVLYLILAAGWVFYFYRSSVRAALGRDQPRRLLLLQPVVVLVLAYTFGLNVPAIAEVFAPILPTTVAMPLFYIATLLALPGLSYISVLRPVAPVPEGQRK